MEIGAASEGRNNLLPVVIAGDESLRVRSDLVNLLTVQHLNIEGNAQLSVLTSVVPAGAVQ